MGHRSLVHRLFIMLIPAVLGLAMLAGRFALPLGAVAAPAPPDADSLPECPRQWERLPKALGGRLSSADGFPVVGLIADVPEFHDCQRLIMPGGKYGTLAAVFAAYNLDTLQRLVGEHMAVAGALILDLSLHQNYGWLNIQTGYNCLYMWTTKNPASPQGVDWHARVLPVDTIASRCLKTIDPGTAGGLNLAVSQVVSNIVGDTAPPVARWDWDDVGKLQYIGIRCGINWCEVGPNGFHPSAHYRVPPAPISMGERRVRSTKGWYDQQQLADVGSKAPIPGLVGTVFPGSPLNTLLDSINAGKWFEAAYVNISQPNAHYKKLLNLDAVSDGLRLQQMNVLLFCHGRRDECGIPDTTGANSLSARCGLNLGRQQIIWAQIKPALGGKPKFGCIKRYDHSMELKKTIPNTARWRWLLDDETIWKECIQGCCEVESSTS